MTMTPARSSNNFQNRRGQPDKLRRFKRTPDELAHGYTKLSDTDRALLQLVEACRFIDSRQLRLYFQRDEKPRAFLRRLQTLYHAGYLERPPQQLARRFENGLPSRFMVYALGEDGYRTLYQRQPPETFTRNNRAAQATYIDHRLAITEALLTFSEAVDAFDGYACEYLEGEAITGTFSALPRHLDFTETVAVKKRDGSTGEKTATARHVPLYPDALVKLTDPDGAAQFYFLEIDRGTEPLNAGERSPRPIARARTSIRRKLAAYHELAKSGGAKRAGVAPFTVLTITTSAARVAGMLQLARTVAPKREDQWRFFFTTADKITLDDPAAALTAAVWHTPKHDKPLSLLATD